MSIKIFPHVLVRVAGGTFNHFEQLHFHSTSDIAQEIYTCRQELNACKQTLSDIIYAVITSAEAEMQKKLLNAKRDVFNGRALSDEKTALLKQYLPADSQPDGARELERYIALKDRINALATEGEGIYNKEFIALRGKLRELVQGKSFQEGLLLSSQSLLSSINEHYLKLDPEKLTNKDRQTEKGLVKYLSRMYSKTTPFSTFTNLAMAKVEPTTSYSSSAFHTSLSEAPAIKSHIRLNNFLYQFLKALLTKSPDIARCLPIRPNPTIQKTATHFLFLTNSNNVEAFQRIPPSPILDLFLELIAEHAAGLTVRDFAKMIIDGEYIEAEQEQIEGYIKQLVEYGFFEYNIGVSGIDPDWDIKLREQLAPLAGEFPLLGELSDVLVQIRKYAERYGEVLVDERKQILVDAHTLFRAVAMKIHEAAGLPEDERKTPDERAAEARQKMKEEQEKAKAKKAEEEKAKKANGEEIPTEENKIEEGKAEETDETKEEASSEDADSVEKKEEAFKHQSNTYFSYKPEQMFYEDSTLEVHPVINHDELTTLATKLHTLQQTLWTFGGMKDEQDTMLHFFTEKYGAAATVDVVTFYEEYFREWKKPEAERQQKAREEQARIAREKKEKEKQEKEQQEKAADSPTPIAATKAEEVKAEEAKPEVAPQATEKTVPDAPVIQRIKERQERNKAWTDKYTDVLRSELAATSTSSSSDTIHLRFEPVQRVTGELEYPVPREVANRSYGMFVQFFRERDSDGNEQLKGVLNASLSGFGKMISRFMHIFEGSITDDVRTWNSATANDAILIEDCDASYFNANLHPPLMPHEIWMPGGHNTLPAEKQIPVTDLVVKLGASGDRLELFHKMLNKTAYVFDLGFQGHGGRSQLFQLLEKFTRAEYLNYYPLLSSLSTATMPQAPKPEQGTEKQGAEAQETEKQMNNAAGSAESAKPQPRIRTRPRVVYEDQLVLQRKAWFVPKELLPLRSKQETDWQYFERLNTWRSEQGMPEEIFLFVNPRENQNNQENVDTDAAKRVTRDDYKPQYISFRNPFMVKLFEGLLSKVMSTLKIEEMLPNSEQMAEIAQQKYVTECVVQWYV